MPVSDDYLEFVLEQLSVVGPVTARKMFGGAGIYLRKQVFALVANDMLYLKVDDSNRADYEAMDMGPFKPFEDKPYAMSYYEVPAEVMEDPSELKAWARKALAAAKKKTATKKKPKRKKSS